jgi:dihydropyrimidinase
MYDLAIIGGELYIDGSYVRKNLYIQDGKIASITDEVLDSADIYNAVGKKVLPGFIDPHVHFELNVGKYTSCDDFYWGSVSGAYGGITTFIDFLDPVDNSKELEDAFISRRKLAEKSVVDYGFHATVKNPVGEVDSIVKTMKKLGLHSVKLFTTYSDSGRRTYDNEIIEFLKLSSNNDFIVLAHIEEDELINLDKSFEVADLVISRSSRAELNETLKLARYTRDYDGNLYMVHLSSGNTIRALRDEYSDILNKNFFVESCPQYFSFGSEVFNKNNGYLYALAPPLRSEEEIGLLVDSFDYIDTIGTDHCPFMKEEKYGKRLVDMPMGIGGIEHSFSVMYSLFGDKVIDKMTVNPAKIHGLYPKKGVLLEGSDGDVVIYDCSRRCVIEGNHSRCDYSVYDGCEVVGEVVSTISRGKFVVRDGEFVGGSGEYVRG